MVDRKVIDELSERLARLIPKANAMGEDVRQTLSSGLQQGFSKMDLLTREEFEQHREALARAEKRVEELEASVARLERILEERS